MSKAADFQELKKRSVFLLRGFAARIVRADTVSFSFPSGTYSLNKDEAIRLAAWLRDMFEADVNGPIV